MAIFGLDGTLYDNRPRTLQILLELSEELRASDREVADALSSLSLERVHYLLSDTLRECGVARAEVIRDVTSYWRERFFTDDYATIDHEIPGAHDYVRALHEAGASVVYLTGRDVPGMMLGTIASLRDDGFPVCSAGVQVVLKPDATLGDETFKRRAFRRLKPMGDVVALFDSSPAICDTARAFFPDADLCLVDTWHLEPPDAAARVELVNDFRMS